MAKIYNDNNTELKQNSARIPEYVWQTSKYLDKMASSDQMYFDIRELGPGKYSFPYHYHRGAEEMMVILQGGCTMRTPEGFSKVQQGDIVFFEKGETGAHQFYNHTDEVCRYLDIRIKVDIDVCDYPDSGKVNILPYFNIYNAAQTLDYFEGEEGPSAHWASFFESKE